MAKINNDIVNVNVGTTSNYNDIDNVYSKSKNIEVVADRLMNRLGAKPESRPFLCKAAYKLSEAKIWDNVEAASKGRNPMGLFIWLCKRDGV